MRPLKIAVDIKLLFELEQAKNLLGSNQPLEGAFRNSVFSQMLQLILRQNKQLVKFYWLLNCPQEMAHPLADTLNQMGFCGEAPNLTDPKEIIDYLDRSDLFFSDDSHLLYEASGRGVLGGYLPKQVLEADKLTIAFEHRIFMDDYNLAAIRSWLRVLGHLQKSRCPVRTALITSSTSSVEKRVIELFQFSHCAINELFFLAAGNKQDVFRLFGPCLYLEGKKRKERGMATQGRPLLFV